MLLKTRGANTYCFLTPNKTPDLVIFSFFFKRKCSVIN